MNKNLKIFLIVIIIIIAASVGILAFWKSAGQNKKMDNNSNTANIIDTVILPDGLQITDEIIGAGAEAKNGNVVAVNYFGILSNGVKFDSSYDRGRPFSFVLGAGQVIKGWDKGVLGMKVGGKRKLVIPPNLAYGEQGAGGGIIPPNSTLIFEVELLGVQAK